MRLSEALEVLALRPGATPAEIKEAYRDLVKVWHPDRFGSDLRLRQKAEAKLKEINEAYRLLLMNPEAGEARYSAVYQEPTSSTPHAESSSRPVAQRGHRRSRGIVMKTGWVYAGLTVSMAFLVGLFVFAHAPVRDAGLARDPALSMEDAKGKGAPDTPAEQMPEDVIAGNDVHSVGLVDRKIFSKDPRDMNRASSAHPSVRPLSDAETARIETACSKFKGMQDDAVYRECIKAQLDLITNASGRPDLSGLDRAERESIESVCSRASRRRSAEGYNRCLIAQMANVAAEPVRPDLSTLNDADRGAVEVACRSAKYREGPAAYDRCLARTIRLLQQTR